MLFIIVRTSESRNVMTAGAALEGESGGVEILLLVEGGVKGRGGKRGESSAAGYIDCRAGLFRGGGKSSTSTSTPRLGLRAVGSNGKGLFGAARTGVCGCDAGTEGALRAGISGTEPDRTFRNGVEDCGKNARSLKGDLGGGSRRKGTSRYGAELLRACNSGRLACSVRTETLGRSVAWLFWLWRGVCGVGGNGMRGAGPMD